MNEEKVFAMPFSRVWGLLVAKAERKGRTRAEVTTVALWLTGYTEEDMIRASADGITYGAFFENAPHMNPKRTDIHGSVCGVKLDLIENPLMRDIRVLDKLVDDLAKGKPLEKILP